MSPDSAPPLRTYAEPDMSEPPWPWNGTPMTSSGLRSPSTSPEASDQPAWSSASPSMR